MPPSLDEQYLTWLYARIGNVRETRPSMTYHALMELLFIKEFIWIIPNDDNRVEDGRYLRYQFLEEAGLTGDVDPNWMGMGCSVLEMLIGVANRLAFEADRTPQIWFWELLNNLGLSGYNDQEFNENSERRVNEILDNLIWRTYRYDGQGGLFPLKRPTLDQRDVEIWYQLNAYLNERV